MSVSAASAANPEADTEDESQLPRYPVGAVAERLGVPTATLRSWNQRYGVGPPDHHPGRHRLYSEMDIAVLQEMQNLISEGASPRSAAHAAMDTVAPPRADTSALLAAAFDLDVAVAGRLLDSHLRHYGVLDTWDELVRPAFGKIESQQAGGFRCIDVEHALSWTVARALQRLPIARADTVSSVLLACTEGETHTLALEALRAALGERGAGAVMLGADVPLDAILDGVHRRPRRVSVVLWSQTGDTADVETAAAVVATAAEVFVGGPGWASTALPPAVVAVDSLRSAVQRLTAE